MKLIILVSLLLAGIGLMDAGYLTYEHYSDFIPPCTTSVIFADCGKVLTSAYATVFGVPLAGIGVVHYSLLTIALVLAFFSQKRIFTYLVILSTTIGFLSSVYFVYLQLFVIGALCFYCIISALTSLALFILAQIGFSRQRKQLCVATSRLIYTYVIKHLFFLFDAETVHIFMAKTGNLLGKTPLRWLFTYAWVRHDPRLTQTIADITFQSPIGLAAGFDYEAQLTQILPALGFGFQTVGTITNHPYEGNPRPQLGRLPRSKSLMVNKGFRNLGTLKTIEKLAELSFAIAVGVSIGRTNTKDLKTQKQSIADICQAFSAFEQSHIPHAYYELNISCPNLFGDITFYPPKNLDALLTNIDKLKLSRPVFIKMPIEKSNSEVLAMLGVIAKHQIVGVIFGNLQKNRQHPTLSPDEVAQYPVGNFSGRPTYTRSNELISLTHKHYKKRFVIIGCGGVFSAEDAYEKIRRGASLVQLITGMIFEGPQLIADINLRLPQLLQKNGFAHISEAIGSKNRLY